jgi:uncharacterized membrane protein
MHSRSRIAALRVALLLGLGTSAAIQADAVQPGKKFCPLEAACDKAHGSALGQFFGVSTSLLGMAAFGFFFAATLLPVERSRTMARLLGIGALTFSVAFLGYQALVLGTFCPLCLVADAAGLTAGVIALTWPPLPRRRSGVRLSTETGGSRLWWGTLAALVLALPFGWPREKAPAWVEVPVVQDFAGDSMALAPALVTEDAPAEPAALAPAPPVEPPAAPPVADAPPPAAFPPPSPAPAVAAAAPAPKDRSPASAEPPPAPDTPYRPFRENLSWEIPPQHVPTPPSLATPGAQARAASGPDEGPALSVHGTGSLPPPAKPATPASGPGPRTGEVRGGSQPVAAPVGPKAETPRTAPKPAPTAPEPPKGAARHAVVIVEYLNAFCPHCRAMHAKLARLVAEATVPVRRHRIYAWASDDYPLWARACAYAQTLGKEEEMFSALLQARDQSAGEVQAAARRAGLDVPAVMRAIRDPMPPERLVHDRRIARGARLAGLPTIDIGRRRMTGEASDETLRDAIRAAAAAAK